MVGATGDDTGAVDCSTSAPTDDDSDTNWLFIIPTPPDLAFFMYDFLGPLGIAAATGDITTGTGDGTGAVTVASFGDGNGAISVTDGRATIPVPLILAFFK